LNRQITPVQKKADNLEEKIKLWMTDHKCNAGETDNHLVSIKLRKKKGYPVAPSEKLKLEIEPKSKAGEEALKKQSRRSYKKTA
jgi:hypothetical protein